MKIDTPNLEYRPAAERGSTELGWLHSHHSFSFGRYHDPQRVSYRSLRVLNDDVVDPGGGFGEHSHRNMEIITWVLSGALQHTDSTGTREQLRPGEAQVMSAGRGIRHSEMNASDTEPAHFLQMWIDPATQNAEPAYRQQHFNANGRLNRWQTIASATGEDGSLTINQDAILRIADVHQSHDIVLRASVARYAYVHVATGLLQAGDYELGTGDAFILTGLATINLEAQQDAQVLWFDLA